MIDKVPTVANHRRGSVALVLAVGSLVVSLLSCGLVGLLFVTPDVDLLPVQSTPETASASQVEALAGVTLPPGTVFLAAAYSNGLETRLSAKFRISRTQLDAFLASATFTAELTPGLRAVSDHDDVGGGNLWHPDAAVSVSGFNEQQPMADGTYRSLLLDLDEAETITVYLCVSRG